MLKILFAINPISGGKVKNDWEAAIRQYFKNSEHQAEIFLLTGNNDMTSIRHHIQTVKPDRIVAVGGDGTVKLVAEIVQSTNTPLGIIPAGSANGMAKELGLPTEVNEALDVIVKGTPKKVDLIMINEKHVSIHLGDIGLNAMLVKNFESSKSRGMWGYGKTLIRMLWEKQKVAVNIETDTNKISCEAYMIVLANARKYGTGANINPEGDVSDGKFEVVVVKKLNVVEIVKAMFTDKSFSADKIEVHSTTKAKITTNKRFYFQIDGEFLGKTQSLTAKILPGVLTVMVPEESATGKTIQAELA